MSANSSRKIFMINESNAHDAKGGGVSAQFLWRIVTFMAGALLALGIAWGTRSSQLEEVRASMGSMQADLKGFMKVYQDNDKATSNDIIEMKGHLDRIEDHIANDDRRIEQLEAGHR